MSIKINQMIYHVIFILCVKLLTVTSGEILTSRETSTRPGSGISPGSKHSNTSMLQLNTTKVVEAILVSIGNVTERIPTSKLRGGGTDFVIEGSGEGGGGLGDRDGGESGGRADDGSEDSTLHFTLLIGYIEWVSLVVGTLVNSQSAMGKRTLPFTQVLQCIC